MIELSKKLFSSLGLFLIFLVACKKDKEYQSTDSYGTVKWICSVADTNYFDTLATPNQTGGEYLMIFTRAKDEHSSKAIHHYWNEELVHHQTVEQVEFVDYSGSVRTIYHLTFSDQLITYRMDQQGISSYNYEYPYRTINGVRVKNIFKFGF